MYDYTTNTILKTSTSICYFYYSDCTDSSTCIATQFNIV